MTALTQPDIITFDCYGTLIDWEAGIVNAFQSEAQRDGIGLESAEILKHYAKEEPTVEGGAYRSYREVLTVTALRVARNLGWPLDQQRAAFLSESLPSWKPFPDTNAALERLAPRYSLGILSNVDDDLLAETLRDLTVPFEILVTAQQVGSYKPAHAHFIEAHARAGPKRVLHAAQSHFHDVIPAVTLGIPVAWVNRKGERLDESDLRPTYEVSNLTELADLLSR
jgi:2-haloacid dehalogenase/putative hydrolase of the HAD superfamily